MEPCIEYPESSSELQDIIETAKEWALMNGIGLRVFNDCNKDVVESTPFTLLPSSIPCMVYLKACSLQPILNELTHKVAYDNNFLKEALKETIKTDFFTRKLFDVYETVLKEGCAQKISLGLFRTDFLLEDINSLKQVEINTMCAGMFIMKQSTKLYNMVLKKMGASERQLRNIPDNNVLEEFASGIIQAWNMYEGERDAILFVVTGKPHLFFEERGLEFKIKRLNPDIKIFRRTLTQLASTAKLGVNKELIVDNNIIAVVYFKSGFKPEHYPSEAEWNARLLMEMSRAIMCPSIQYQLAGTKKVQQILSQPGVLESFFKNPKIAASRVRKVFTGLYSLDFTKEGDRAVEMAMANPEKFVLKSERDGGGNNFYGSDIRDVLQILTENKQRPSWILMDKISTVSHSNYFIKPQKTTIYEPTESICELSIFGVIIGDSSKIFANKQAGYGARAKTIHSNEAGIFSGHGAVSSIYLV